jgi:hypothetical protein
MSAAEAKPSPGHPSASAPVLALDVAGACVSLGVSWDLWREHIEPEVRIVRLGRRKLVPVIELEKWLDRHAETTLGDR